MTTATDVLNGGSATPPSGDPAPATPPAGGTSPATPPTGGEGAWYAAHPDENIRNWAANKGWNDPMAALDSSYNLEKLIGFEKAGRTLVMPKEDATPEERTAFFRKLGVPEKVDGYKVPEAMAADPFIKQFQEQALKTNMLPQQFEDTLNWYQNTQKAAIEAQQQAFVAAGEQAIATLKGDWGQAYDQNIELARRAANQFLPAGTPEERKAQMHVIEQAVGTEAMLRFFARIGEGLGEHKTHSDGSPGGFDVMTPAQAKAKIEALKSDKEWAAAYVKGDAGKREEMARLHKFAYPEAA